MLQIIGLAGPSAAGKTTLAADIATCANGVETISVDDFYRPPHECPRFGLAGLPWPESGMPAAFRDRGDADLNSPDAIRWEGVLDAIDAGAIDAESIIVEGLLLFADHPGAQEVLCRCDHLAVLWADGDDDQAMRALQQRKRTRAHLGKPSYAARGVSEAAYAIYWQHHVWPRWAQHGASRVPAGALRIPCLDAPSRQRDALIATGWLTDAPDGEAEAPGLGAGGRQQGQRAGLLLRGTRRVLGVPGAVPSARRAPSTGVRHTRAAPVVGFEHADDE